LPPHLLEREWMHEGKRKFGFVAGEPVIPFIAGNDCQGALFVPGLWKRFIGGWSSTLIVSWMNEYCSALPVSHSRQRPAATNMLSSDLAIPQRTALPDS